MEQRVATFLIKKRLRIRIGLLNLRRARIIAMALLERENMRSKTGSKSSRQPAAVSPAKRTPSPKRTSLVSRTIPVRKPPNCACVVARGPKHPYRVFISYSHQNQALAEKVKEHLSQQGLFPITDHEIRVGEAFSEEIREMIECSHVFVPLVTPSANERLWVQQEIGYATALHVPVCPIAVGNLPSGMAEHIQGIHVKNKDNHYPTNARVMEVVRKRLTYEIIDDLLLRARRRPRHGRYECALYWNDRQEILVNLTEAAIRDGCRLARKANPRKAATKAILGAKACVLNCMPNPSSVRPAEDRRLWRLRQSTAFGSFSIPDAALHSEEWYTRDPNRYRSTHERRLLRKERIVMERYALIFGCDMILDPRGLLKQGFEIQQKEKSKPNRNKEKISSSAPLAFKHPPDRTALRLHLMIQFLKSQLDNDRIRIVIPTAAGQITTNLIIVGDWFASEAVVPLYHTGGYERTLFTRHAPTILNIIDRFDQDFDDHLRDNGFDLSDPATARKAKQKALDQLTEWHALQLEYLKNKENAPGTDPRK